MARTSTRKESRKKDFNESATRPPRNNKLLGTIKTKPDPLHRPLDIYIQLTDDLWSKMNYLWTSKDRNACRPPSFRVSEINPSGVDALSRQDKRGMLRELANTDLFSKKQVQIQSRKDSSFPEGFPTSGYLSTAAIFVTAIALRSGKPSTGNVNADQDDWKHRGFITKLFAELVGCATADTIDELSQYLRPPLIELEHVPTFIHCAVRQIARGKEHRSHEPVKLTMCTIEAIAAALDQFRAENKTESENSPQVGTEKDDFVDLLSSTLSNATIVATEDRTGYTAEELKKQYSRDLGCHAGLLIAGFQRYFFRLQAEDEAKERPCHLFIDVSTGMLTDIPMAGFVFGPVGSLAKFGATRWGFGKREEKRRQLSQKLQHHFDKSLAAPIFFDGEFSEKTVKEGLETVTVHKADWEEFSTWYDQMMSWNHMEIQRLRDKDVKKEKIAKRKERRQRSHGGSDRTNFAY